jgi:hypothetical protein
MRETVRFEFADDLAAYNAFNSAQAAFPLATPDDIDANLLTVTTALAYLHKYQQGRDAIDKARTEVVRQSAWDWPTYRIGRVPIADERGWLDLQLGDAQAAKQDGKRIMSFLASHGENPWNSWFRELLRADAQLFLGEGKAAIATADHAVALTRAASSVSDQMNAFVWATMVRAWAGAGDEAAARLETLASSVPGLWSGEIVRDPLWALPLAHNARYLQLCERLKAQMQGMRFAPVAANQRRGGVGRADRVS